MRQLSDRTLQRRLLRFEGRQGLIALGLGLADDVGGFLLGALDEFVALALTFGHVLIVDALSQSDETVGIPVAAGCGGTEADSGCATGSGGHGRSLRARCARILGGSRSGFLDDGSRSLSLLDRCRGGRGLLFLRRSEEPTPELQSRGQLVCR